MAIVKERYLWGTRYWAIWYPLGHFIPRYDLCTYLGQDKDLGLYYFANTSKTRKGIFAKSYGQLNIGITTNTFKPFLLDMKRLNDYIDILEPRID